MPGKRGTVYVYGVLSEAERRTVSVEGVEGAAVRTVSGAGLAALVSDLEAETLTAAKEVRAHWRVLEEASTAATVLPVRFGTVMESDEAVRRELLEPNAERLVALLGELGGRVQLSVKADYDEDELLRRVVADSPHVAALRERLKGLPEEAGYYDRIRLGELVSSEIEHRREEDRARALGRLEPLAVSAREEAVSGVEGAFNLAFLVDRDRVDSFSAAVRSLAEETGERLRVRYVGPLPPYSFTDAELVAGGSEWG
ncbi:MAG: GvpL/GvpF family gas vesicle protein [Thermoleophilaceae bacterium]